MLANFPEIVESAVPVESHTDKYVDTRRENPNLKAVRVLLGALQTENGILPVELEIKEFRVGASDGNKLYMAVTLKSIEDGIVTPPPTELQPTVSIPPSSAEDGIFAQPPTELQSTINATPSSRSVYPI